MFKNNYWHGTLRTVIKKLIENIIDINISETLFIENINLCIKNVKSVRQSITQDVKANLFTDGSVNYIWKIISIFVTVKIIVLW